MVNTKTENLFTANFFLAWGANFLMGFAFYLLMPTLPFYLVEKYGADKGVVGLIMSSYVIAALLIRPFSGFMVDTFSRKMVYIISFLLFVILTGGYVVAASITLLFVLRFLHGLTWGVVTTAGNTISIDIMPASRRGEGIGVFGLSLPLSMSFGPMAGLFLFDHFTFEVIFFVATFIGSVGLLAAFFISVPAKEHHHTSVLSLDRFFMVKGIPLGINMAIISFTYGILLAFGAMFGKELKVDNTGWFFTLLAVGMIISRTFSGQMIDRGKLKAVTVLSSIALFIGFMLLAFANSSFIYFGSALFIGLGYGVLSPAFQTMFVSLGNHHQRGTANSTFLTAFDFGVGLGMLGAGKLAELTSLSTTFTISAVICIFSLIFLVRVTLPYHQKHKLVGN